jgi:glycosyltransferase involved in cell wall biosynthesis
MIETVETPRFLNSDFAAAKKRPGISAFMRLHNEEDFAAAALNSILPFFDEIIVVYNICTDRTPDIVADFARKYPECIKAYHYVPEVFPPGSPVHSKLRANSVHSLVHYTNFAASRATRRVRCIWDGDEIAIPKTLGRVTQKLRALRPGSVDWMLSPQSWGYWYYSGVNLWDQNGVIHVPQSLPEVGQQRDHGFWPARRWHIYRRYLKGEYLFRRLMIHKWVGHLHYHVKGMKRDRGLAGFQLDKYPDSLHLPFLQKYWMKPTLKPFSEWRAQTPYAAELPDPESLGIRPLLNR